MYECDVDRDDRLAVELTLMLSDIIDAARPDLNEPSSHDVGGDFCRDLVKYDAGAALATAANCCERHGIDPTAAMPKAIECDRALGYDHEVLETLERAQKKAHDKDARGSAE